MSVSAKDKMTTSKVEGGKSVSRYVREYCYVCDLRPDGEKKMRQIRLAGNLKNEDDRRKLEDSSQF